MQRINNLHNKLKAFNELYRKLRQQLNGFNVNIQPTMYDQFASLFGVPSSSSQGLTERTSLLSAEKQNVITLDEDSAECLTEWYTSSLINTLKECDDVAAQLGAWLANETKCRDEINQLLKNLHEAIEEKIENDKDEYQALLSISKKTANHLLQGVNQSITTIYPELQLFNNTFAEKIKKIEEELSRNDKSIEHIKSEYNDKERLVDLAHNMPALKRLEEMDTQKKLYKSVSTLLEGSEWGGEWNRDIPSPNRVSNLMKEWNALKPRVEKQKKALSVIKQKYEQMPWERYQEAYELISRRMPALLSYFDIKTIRMQLVGLIKPLLEQTSSVVDKQQQIKLVKEKFDELIRLVDEQSNDIATNMKHIESLKKSVASELEIQNGKIDLEASVEELADSLNSMYREYDWRINLVSQMIDQTIPELDHAHSSALLEVLVDMLSSEAHQALCREAIGEFGEMADRWNKEQRKKMFDSAIIFINKQRALFAEEERKVAATNLLVKNQLEEMNQGTLLLLEATKYYTESLITQRWIKNFDIGAVETQLNTLQDEVKEKASSLENEWLTEPVWPSKLKKDFNTRQANPGERLEELWENLRDIRRSFGQLNKSSRAKTSNSDRYNNAVETYSQLMQIVNQIHEDVNALLTDESTPLKVCMSEFDELMKRRIEEAVGLLSKQMQNDVSRMSDDLYAMSLWSENLNALKPDYEKFSAVLPLLQQHKSELDKLEKKWADSQNAVKSMHQDEHSQLTVIPISMHKIKKYWIQDAFGYFEHCYQMFISEEIERDRYAREAAEWIEKLKPNYELLKQAVIFCESVCTEKEAVNRSHKSCLDKQAILFGKLDKLSAQLKFKEKFNIDIRASLVSLKQAVVEQLSELKPESQFSVAKFSFSLRELMLAEDSSYWEERKVENEKLENALRLQPDNAEKSRIKLNEITALMRKFIEIVNEGEISGSVTSAQIMIASGGAVIQSSLNPVLAAKEAADKYVHLINYCITRQNASRQNIVVETNQLNNDFYNKVSERLLAVEEDKKLIEQEEKKLHQNVELIVAQDKTFSNSVTELRDSFDSLVSQVKLNIYPNNEVPALDGDEQLSPLAQSLIQQGNVNESNGHVNGRPEVEVLGLEELKQKLADAVKKFASDESRTGIDESMRLIADRVALLQGRQDKLENAAKIHAKRQLCENNLLMLRNEKDRLVSKQAINQQKLLDWVQTILSETSCANIIKSAESPMGKLDLLLKKIKGIAATNERVKKRLASLEASAPKLKLMESNAYTHIKKMLQNALKRLQIDTYDIQKEWLVLLQAYQQKVHEETSFDTARPLKFLFPKLKLAFNELSTLQNWDAYVEFDSSVAGLYFRQLRTQVKNILIATNLPQDELDDFFLGCVQDYSTPIIEYVVNNQEKINGIYHSDMGKIRALYQWLLETSERIASFNVLTVVEEIVSVDKIKSLDVWIERCMQPFNEAYKVLCAREEKIKQLDNLISSLESQKNALPVSALPAVHLRRELQTIESELALLSGWQRGITARAKQIQSFLGEESLFERTIASDFMNAPAKVFLRFKFLFLSDSETKIILDKLEGRANAHEKSGKKPNNVIVIRAFIRALRECKTNLVEFSDLIMRPFTLVEPALTVDRITITLVRSRNGLTESGELIQQLSVKLRSFIANQTAILFVDDLRAEFAAQKEQLKTNTDYLNPEAGETIQLKECIFSYYCEALENAVKVDTNHNLVVQGLIGKLQPLKDSLDDELTKLKKLREIIKEQYEQISRSRGGLFGLYARGTRDSRLAKALQPLMDHLEQTLASYIEPASSPRPDQSVSSSGVLKKHK